MLHKFRTTKILCSLFQWLYFAELPANRLELSPARRFEERGVGARDAREERGKRPHGPQGRNTDRSFIRSSTAFTREERLRFVEHIWSFRLIIST